MKRRARRIREVKGEKRKDKLCQKERGQAGYGYEVPPHPGFVAIYFEQKHMLKEAEHFFAYYEKEGWKTITGKSIRNWKVLASDWIFNLKIEQRRTARLNKFLRNY